MMNSEYDRNTANICANKYNVFYYIDVHIVY